MIKWYFKQGVKHKVHNGAPYTFFWLDWWVETSPLGEWHPRLSNCSSNPVINVRSAHDHEDCWYLFFRQPFGPAEAMESENLSRKLQFFTPSDQEDAISWSLEASGGLSTNLIYVDLSQGAAITHFKEMWKTRVTLKIKMFLWQLIRCRLRCI
jgi:hypothetical protein